MSSIEKDNKLKTEKAFNEIYKTIQVKCHNFHSTFKEAVNARICIVLFSEFLYQAKARCKGNFKAKSGPGNFPTQEECKIRKEKATEFISKKLGVDGNGITDAIANFCKAFWDHQYTEISPVGFTCHFDWTVFKRKLKGLDISSEIPELIDIMIRVEKEEGMGGLYSLYTSESDSALNNNNNVIEIQITNLERIIIDIKKASSLSEQGTLTRNNQESDLKYHELKLEALLKSISSHTEESSRSVGAITHTCFPEDSPPTYEEATNLVSVSGSVTSSTDFP